jgi:MOSC domain-containing protein YiiM
MTRKNARKRPGRDPEQIFPCNNVRQANPYVAAVAAAKKHTFNKGEKNGIWLIAGRGIQGDAHCGATVQHLYDKTKDASRPNLRQVHVIEAELIDHLQTLGFDVSVGELGENVVTRNIDLVELHAGTRLKLGEDAIIEITGLRAPCFKIERFKTGLRRALTAHRCGQAYMRSAVMAVVIESGTIRAGDKIQVKGRGDGSRIPLRPV